MIDPTETQIYKTKISILTIPRKNFWIFKSGILEIIYFLIDKYEQGKNSEYYSDNETSSVSESSEDERSISNDSFYSNSNKMTTSMSMSMSISMSISNSIDNIKEEANLKTKTNNSEIDEEFDDDGLFFHLAFTTEEITLMCSSKLIFRYLKKSLEFDNLSTLLKNEFFIIQVFSDGLNIGKKILELTKPLSLNNISLFFISNYFSDLVLVPIKDKEKVFSILKNIDLDDNTNNNNLESNIEDKTFELFKVSSIKPKLVTDIKLILTGARSGDYVQILKQTAENLSRLNTEEVFSDKVGKKENKLLFPEFFAITRIPTKEIGLLLPHDSNELNKLNYSKNNIMGSLQDFYYPIFIDLKDLPVDLKGIVAGIASKLLKIGLNEMSYLSFGKSGVVLIPENFNLEVEEMLSSL